MYVRYVGAKTVYVIIIDGGADWVAAVQMVSAKYPWIYGVHCVGHCGALVVKDICRIPEVL